MPLRAPRRSFVTIVGSLGISHLLVQSQGSNRETLAPRNNCARSYCGRRSGKNENGDRGYVENREGGTKGKSVNGFKSASQLYLMEIGSTDGSDEAQGWDNAVGVPGGPEDLLVRGPPCTDRRHGYAG